MLLAAALAIAYLIARPASADLAAQTFRADLFGSHGFLIWNNDWYAGHYLPGYSVLFPPLGAALGPRLVGAFAAVAAAGLFAALARRRYGDGARLGVLWFGAGTATLLLTGRMTFALGVAVGLGALLAVQRGRLALAAALAVLTSLASPVAGLFLALAGVAVMLAGERAAGAAVAAPAALLTTALALAFPSTGEEPFVFTAFLPVPLFAAAALWLIPREQRALRWGVALYFLLALAAFVVPNPLGGNAARLGALFGGPLLALALTPARTRALALVAVPLLYWQWVGSARDLADAVGDPSTERGYYQPLLTELDRLTFGPVRIEIPPTRNRWEATYVAPRYPLARGWLRQLESDDFDLFQDGNLTPRAYRDWLDEQGISYVAFPDADLDYLADDEADLIRSGLRYLRPEWRNEHWRLYRVERATGLVGRPGDLLTSLEPSSFALSARKPGGTLVRVRFTRYWSVTEGDACVEREGDWTRVEVRRPGSVRVAARFSPDALVGRDRECSA
jgi:hypothetical protein